MKETTRIRSIYRIPDGPDAAGRARRIAARELGETGSPELVDNVSLLLGEIVTERMSHRQHSRLTVDVRQSPHRNRWSVVDRGSPEVPRGLRATALDVLADAWGVTRKSGQTRTWFELER